MSLSDTRRKLLILLAGLPLATACGFAPAYGPGSPAAGLRGRIHADDPADRDGFDLVARLEERLGRPQAADLALSYSIDTDAERLARTAVLRESRVQITGRVRFELRRAGDGTVLTAGTVSDFAAYSTTSTPVANRAAEEDARRRLMRMLADGIVARLLATAGDWAGAAGAP
jgi:LPS-assembly lipoprotein